MDKKKGSSSSSLSEKTRKRVIKELEKTDLRPVAPFVPREALSGNTKLRKSEKQTDVQKVDEEGWLARNKWTVLLVVCGIVLVGGGIYYYYCVSQRKNVSENVHEHARSKHVPKVIVNEPSVCSPPDPPVIKEEKPVEKQARVVVEEEENATPPPVPKPNVQVVKKQPVKKVSIVPVSNEVPKPAEPEKTSSKPLSAMSDDSEVIIE